MTLTEVAAKLRAKAIEPGDSDDAFYGTGMEDAVAAFEADPEFKLPERIEAFIRENEEKARLIADTPEIAEWNLELADRLRRILWNLSPTAVITDQGDGTVLVRDP